MPVFLDQLRRNERTLRRFLAKVDRSGDCWLWTAGTARNAHHRREGLPGYGYFHDGVRQVMAHRWAYEHFVGPIPAGHEIDHLCHSTLCVRPDHLRTVTRAQNAQNRKACAAHSTTGARGVYRSHGAYEARAYVAGRRHYGGTYDSIEEAAEAARALRQRVMTHSLN